MSRRYKVTIELEETYYAETKEQAMLKVLELLEDEINQFGSTAPNRSSPEAGLSSWRRPARTGSSCNTSNRRQASRLSRLPSYAARHRLGPTCLRVTLVVE